MLEKITVVKEFTFDAAHYLPGYDGKCSNLHGHRFVLQVGVKGTVLSNGMVIDFSELKEIVNQKLAGLDHSYLNEVDLPDFPNEMPTAENMVLWIRDKLQNYLRMAAGLLLFIRLYETPTSYAEWRRE